MPSLDATTSAQFAAVGLTASTIYATFQTLAGTAVNFGLWLVQVQWPFLLIIGAIYLLWKLAHRFTGFGR